MLKRPDEDFMKLKDALIELGQVHVTKYLEPSATDSTDRADELASARAARTDFSQDYVRGWKNLIVNNRTNLVEELAVNDELISELIKFGVINVTFSEMLKVAISFASMNSNIICKYEVPVKYRIIIDDSEVIRIFKFSKNSQKRYFYGFWLQP